MKNIRISMQFVEKSMYRGPWEGTSRGDGVHQSLTGMAESAYRPLCKAGDDAQLLTGMANPSMWPILRRGSVPQSLTGMAQTDTRPLLQLFQRHAGCPKA